MSNPINIECEVRAFVTDERYDSLSEKLGRVASFGGEDEQVTYYFSGNGDPDLRIQRNSQGSKIWLKKGRMHDAARREIELKCGAGDFGVLESMFLALGYEVSIKWFRKRKLYTLNGITITLDDTRGYGKIVEFEKVCLENDRQAALADVVAAMKEFGVAETPKEEFESRYVNYKEHWRELTGES